MKLHYYPETDALYVEFQRRPSVHTREIAPDVRLDMDEQGSPVGLVIDHAWRDLDLATLHVLRSDLNVDACLDLNNLED